MTTAHRPTLLDNPVAFAHDVWGSIGAVEDDRLCSYAPTEYAAFSAALREVERLVPADAPDELQDAVGKLSDAAHTWGTMAHSAGVTFSAAAEQMRRALVGSETCDETGIGFTRVNS